MTKPSTWRKSTYSGPDEDCVEISLTTERALVRDTKNRDGGTIRLSPAAWSAFIAAVIDGCPRGADKIRPV